MLLVAAWLCGWALAEPDPVSNRVHLFIFAACTAFAFSLTRAAARDAWALLRPAREIGLVTVGFIRPRIVLSPELAKLLDEHAMRAALEHEHVHARHRDALLAINF